MACDLLGDDLQKTGSMPICTMVPHAENPTGGFSECENLTKYRYDAADQRVAKAQSSVVAGLETVIYVNKGLEIRNQSEVQYVFHGSQRLARIDNGTVHYFTTNHLGSIEFVTDSAGTVLSSSSYLPFGAPEIESGSPDEPFKFSGKERERATGLYYFGARWLNPYLGRWMSVDPHQLWRTNLEPYEYVANNPYLYIDRFGLLKTIYVVMHKGVKPKELQKAKSIVQRHLKRHGFKVWVTAWLPGNRDLTDVVVSFDTKQPRRQKGTGNPILEQGKRRSGMRRAPPRRITRGRHRGKYRVRVAPKNRATVNLRAIDNIIKRLPASQRAKANRGVAIGNMITHGVLHGLGLHHPATDSLPGPKGVFNPAGFDYMNSQTGMTMFNPKLVLEPKVAKFLKQNLNAMAKMRQLMGAGHGIFHWSFKKTREIRGLEGEVRKRAKDLKDSAAW